MRWTTRSARRRRADARRCPPPTGPISWFDGLSRLTLSQVATWLQAWKRALQHDCYCCEAFEHLTQHHLLSSVEEVQLIEEVRPAAPPAAAPHAWIARERDGSLWPTPREPRASKLAFAEACAPSAP